MIYADVTGACLLPLQSGIPRTTRGLFHLLETKTTLLKPVMWQPFFHGYTELSREATGYLKETAVRPGQGAPVPAEWIIPFLWAGLRNVFSGARKLPLKRLLKSGDTLLVTSIVPDNRLLYLGNLMNGEGRKVAIFHDAIQMLDPNEPRITMPFHVAQLRLLSNFDLVICVSRASETELKKLWKKHGMKECPTQVLAWPVPFPGQRPAFIPPREEGKKILYVARLKRVKNHAVLLKACQMLWKDGVKFKLELVGCHNVSYESDNILNEINRLRLEGFPLEWRGHVSEEELHEAYATSTFTAFPSLMEGFGLPIVESFWHGRPVVCSREGAVAEVSQGAGTVGVDVNDPQLLAEAMRGLLENPVRCRNLAQEAYYRPLRTWEDYWNELEPLL